jgi:hypothetical protein
MSSLRFVSAPNTDSESGTERLQLANVLRRRVAHTPDGSGRSGSQSVEMPVATTCRVRSSLVP